MKSRITGIILLFLCLFLIVGCSQGQNTQQPVNPQNNQVQTPGTSSQQPSAGTNAQKRIPSPYSLNLTKVKYIEITKPGDFIEKYIEWNDRMDQMAVNLGKIHAAYRAQQLTEAQYRDEITVLAQDMIQINNETDVVYEANLSEADAAALGSKQITKAYAYASKSLWDYMYDVANGNIVGEQINPTYETLIAGKYKADSATLRSLLTAAKARVK